MSIIEDQIFDREAAMGEHIESDEANNLAIISFLRNRVDTDALQKVTHALSSGGNQTFDFGELKVGLGYDGHYHVFERGTDGKFYEVELAGVPDEKQEAA